MKNIRIILPLAAFALLIAGNAFDHRVNVFAWVEGDTVFVESKFSEGIGYIIGLIGIAVYFRYRKRNE